MSGGGKKSTLVFAEAQEVIPGGVNSPVRAFKAVGGIPPFLARGDGSRIYDLDGRGYIDFVNSWGALILGHRHPLVVQALYDCLAEVGTSFGAPTELEVHLAREIIRAVPSMEMVRLVNSGTEATMSAVRLARAHTGRNKIVKFEGCYHGHADPFLVQAGSGALTLGIPSSPGVTPGSVADTLVVPYNDLEAVEGVFSQHGDDIAAVIVEPVAGNMGCVLPEPGFLDGLRRITWQHGSVLIFDEVITGFRVAYGGAQSVFGVLPDLTCLGKIIGGGLPIGAYGGPKSIMEKVAPLGPVYQAGTLAGNPLAVTAGLATLEVLRTPGYYRSLEEKCRLLVEDIKRAGQEAGVPITVNWMGSMFTIFFTAEPVVNLKTALRADTGLYARLFHQVLEQGVYLPPSPFECAFLSSAHTDEDLATAREVLIGAIKSAAGYLQS